MPKNVAPTKENGQLDENGEPLEEFKADHSPSEIADPVSKDAKSPEDDSDPNKETSNLKGTKDEKGSKKRKSKASMVKDSIDIMKDMDVDQLAELHKQINSFLEMDDIEDIDDEDEDDNDEDMKKKKTDEKYSKKKMEMKKVSKEDIDVSADISALFGNEDLSEEFRDQTQTIFEAAVVSATNAKLSEMAEIYEEDMNRQIDESVTEIAKRVDEFLEYSIEQWMEENEVAIENGLKSEITESIIEGFKKVLDENYVDIPEDKVDVFNELAEVNSELENDLNEQIEKNIQLGHELVELKKQGLIDDICEGLVETEKDKLRSLAEGVDYSDDENFMSKLKKIRENYFGSDDVDTGTKALLEDISDEGIQDASDTSSVDEDVDPAVSAVARHLSSNSRK